MQPLATPPLIPTTRLYNTKAITPTKAAKTIEPRTLEASPVNCGCAPVVVAFCCTAGTVGLTTGLKLALLVVGTTNGMVL